VAPPPLTPDELEMVRPRTTRTGGRCGVSLATTTVTPWVCGHVLRELVAVGKAGGRAAPDDTKSLIRILGNTELRRHKNSDEYRHQKLITLPVPANISTEY